jgi:hypothetical protein
MALVHEPGGGVPAQLHPTAFPYLPRADARRASASFSSPACSPGRSNRVRPPGPSGARHTVAVSWQAGPGSITADPGPRWCPSPSKSRDRGHSGPSRRNASGRCRGAVSSSALSRSTPAIVRARAGGRDRALAGQPLGPPAEGGCQVRQSVDGLAVQLAFRMRERRERHRRPSAPVRGAGERSGVPAGSRRLNQWRNLTTSRLLSSRGRRSRSAARGCVSAVPACAWHG